MPKTSLLKCIRFLKKWFARSSIDTICWYLQGRNRRENLVATSAMVGRICPPGPGGDRVKVSENLGATSVAPVAPVDTSLG